MVEFQPNSTQVRRLLQLLLIHNIWLYLQLRALEVLRLGTPVEIRRELGFFHNLENLSILDISSPLVTDEDIEHVAALVNLEELYLTVQSRISDRGMQYLVKLNNLQTLYVASDHISDDGISALHSSETLRYLSVISKRITNRGLTEICHKFPKLKVLSVAYADIDRDGVKSLRDLKELQTLALDETSIDDSAIAEVAVVSLKNLRLGGTHVSDSGLHELARIGSLESLFINDTAVTLDGVIRLISDNVLIVAHKLSGQSWSW